MSMKVEQWQWSDAGGWDARPFSGTLGASAQLVLVFGGAKLVSAQECVAKAHRAFPNARVFGCSTGGEIHGTGVRDGTLAITAITFDHSHVATARAPIEGVDGSFAAGERLVRALDSRSLRHVFVLSEGLRVNGSDLVSGIHAALPPGVSASGGFAADGNSLQETHVWCDGEPEQAAAIALGFYGERLRFGLSVTEGWRPFGPDP